MNCFDCKNRRAIEGKFLLSRCRHPEVEKGDKKATTPVVEAFTDIKRRTFLDIKGAGPSWPTYFNPFSITRCRGFEAK